MKITPQEMLLVAGIGLTTLAHAGNELTAGGMGCGEIISMRKSTQNPLRTEVYEAYAPKGNTATGGQVFQALNVFGGLGTAVSMAGDFVAGQVKGAITSASEEKRKKGEVETNKYDNVMAVEFRFDDGEVVNVPLLVVSGMRYSVGARLTAWVSRFDANLLSLSLRPLFWSAPKPGASDYGSTCRVDDLENRKRILALHSNAVDEAQVVDPEERRKTVPTEERPVSLETSQNAKDAQ